MKAFCSQDSWPQDLGLLSTECAQRRHWLQGSLRTRRQVSAARAPSPGHPPPWCWGITTEWEGSPFPSPGLFFASSHPPSSLEWRGVPPSPWKHDHSQRAEAMQPSLEKQ